MSYSNLRAEMARKNISITDLMKVTGKSRSGVSNNLNGKGSFSVNESLAIRNRFFPELSIDYLFSNEEHKQWSMKAPNEIGGKMNQMTWPDKDFRYGKWEKAIDNSVEMLRCPECKCQVIRKSYESAIGLNGMHYCPYCGSNMWKQ